jgi:isopentenyl diphosphate isomerase/L-lactate dehydrogenase-like FMN-dependent dehydrogenase
VSEIRTTTQIAEEARDLLSAPVWEYIAGGAESEATIWRNREAINSYVFISRVLRDVSNIDPSTTLLGTKLRIPYFLAPVGGLQQVTRGGAATAGVAASAFGTLQVVSSVSEPTLEATAEASTGDKWFQLYIRGDMDWVRDWIARIKKNGYKALVITVDSAYYGNRERQVIRDWLPDWRKNNVTGNEFQKMTTWEDIDRIRDMWGGPVVLKGIQSAVDAEIALKHDIAAIWISNHGGRQLDHCRGALDVLPEVVDVVKGRVPLVVDGGFLRGTDALKAIALGATAVACGRLYAMALAVAAERGVERMLEILEFEITNAMGLLGVTALDQLSAAYVKKTTTPASTRAFPLYDGVF